MQKKSKGRILSITRICGYCGNPFEAHNSTTRFCSRKCYNRDYYLHHAQIMNLKRAELYKKPTNLEIRQNRILYLLLEKSLLQWTSFPSKKRRDVCVYANKRCTT